MLDGLGQSKVPPLAGCPADDELAAHLTGKMDLLEAEAIRGHLDICESCRCLLIALVRAKGIPGPNYGSLTMELAKVLASDDLVPPSPSLVQVGSLIGRYQVDSVLGTGGMGVVYAAMDTELHRVVALKCVKVLSSLTEQFEQAQDRLVREARAMAALQHPNVVTVYDVGKFQDQVYVAMQLVDGGSLRTWLSATVRAQTDILRVLIEAGNGLAAAHGIGLVHRDLKPDNILIGQRGTARLTDFGLAHRVELTAKVDTTEFERSSEPRLLQANDALGLTTIGAVLGTPAYMAPEQAAGATTTAQSDQFSFAVTAWEALFSARPFSGQTVAGIQSNIVEQNITRPPDVMVHPSIEAALRRALSYRPSDRFVKMKHLVAVLHSAHNLTPPPLTKAQQPWVKRRTSQLAIIFVLASAVGGTVYLSKFHSVSTAPLASQDTAAAIMPNAPRNPSPTVTPIARQDVVAQEQNEVDRRAAIASKQPSIDKPKGSAKAPIAKPAVKRPPPAMSVAPSVESTTFAPAVTLVQSGSQQADVAKRQDINARILQVEKLVTGRGLRASDIPGYLDKMKSVNISFGNGDFATAQEQLREAQSSVEQFRISKIFIDNKMLFASKLIAAKDLSVEDKRQLVTPVLSKILQLAKESKYEEANGLLVQLITKLSAL
jgi:serine/threonine protein kinase